MDLSLRDANHDLRAEAVPSSRSLGGLVGAWFLLTMLISVALVWVQQAARVDDAYISVVQFAPTLALVVLICAVPKRVTTVSPLRVGARTFVARGLLCAGVIAACAGMMSIVVVLCGAARAAFPFDSVWLLVLFLGLQLAGACGEEFGWRGLLQPALETRLSRPFACVITGLLWAIWHVPEFSDPSAGALFTVSCIALSIIYGLTVTGSIFQRGLLAGMMHAAVNVTMFLVIAPQAAGAEAVLIPMLFLVICAGVLAAARHSGRRARRDAMTGWSL